MEDPTLEPIEGMRYEINVRTATEVLRAATRRFAPRLGMGTGLGVEGCVLVDLIVNPLHVQGYPSIGCLPCTTRVHAGEDPRAGRWRGREKNECGLHLLAEREH